MTRAFKFYHGEDLDPVYDLTDMLVWEECEFGLRAWNGESINSDIQLRDEEGITSHGGSMQFQARNVGEFTIGTNVLWRGRIANQAYMRARQKADRARESSIYLEDPNIDLRGIVVHGWARPEETAATRVLALCSGYLNGSPRATTIVNTDGVVTAGSVTVPAKTYDQTDPYTILQELALADAKTFYLLPRLLTTDAFYQRLIYAAPDAVVEACPFTISDDPAEVEADSTYFAPRWNVGPAGELTAQQALSGGWMFYGMDSQYAHYADGSLAEITAHWEEVLHDNTQNITDEAGALAMAEAIVEYRRSSERRSNVTIGPMTEAEIVQIHPGQTIDIKARAIPWADDDFYTANIGQLKITTDLAGRYYAHLQLDRPLGLPMGNGTQPIPKPPSPGTPGTCTRLYFTKSDSALTTVAADANWDVQTTDGNYEQNQLHATPQDSYLSTAKSDSTGGGSGVTTDVQLSQHLILMDSALAATIAAGGATVKAHLRARARSGIGISEASQDLISQISIRVTQGASSTIRGTALAMHNLLTSSGAAKWPAQTTPVNRVFPPTPATDVLSAVSGAAAGDYLVVELGYRNFTTTTATGGSLFFYDSSTAGDLPEDETTSTALNSWIDICTGDIPGDTTQPIVNPGEGSVGTDLSHYAPLDHDHEHGLLSDDGLHMHDAVDVQYDPTSSGLEAINVQEALDELEALGGVTDHGALTGLTDDDHPQYLKATGGAEEDVQVHGAMGATETIDLANGNVHTGTLDANCTLTFAGATNGKACSFTLELTEDGTGGWSPTWPASVTWIGGSEPTHDTTASTTTVYGFRSLDGGTTWLGWQAGSGGTASERRILLADGRSTPFAFTDMLQMDDGSDLMWSD